MGKKRKVIVDGTEFEVDIEQDGNTFTATVEGREFKIEVPEAPQAAPKRAARGGKKKKSGKISANIPGKIVTLEVALGDPVSEGQVVLILEAMKMQNEITAPIAGTVVEIHCEEGQSIEANVTLVIIEPKKSDKDEESD
jgi:biotin carboxyl carrier protein